MMIRIYRKSPPENSFNPGNEEKNRNPNRAVPQGLEQKQKEKLQVPDR